MPYGSGVFTGLEGKGVVETLMTFAKVNNAYEAYQPEIEPKPTSSSSAASQQTKSGHARLPRAQELPTFPLLSPEYRRIFPQKLKPTMREPPLPRPPKGHTRNNPKTWSNPSELTVRSITRVYTRLWESLSWSRPSSTEAYSWAPQNGKDEHWQKCSYEEVLLWEQKRWDDLRQASIGKKAKVRAGPADLAQISRATEWESAFIRGNAEALNDAGTSAKRAASTE